MKFILQTIRKIGVSAFILSVCLFCTQTAFSQRTWDGGAGTTAWTDANNWSGDVVPTTSDDVTIIEGADVRITTGTILCNKLIINGSTGSGQGKVTVSSGAILNITNSTGTNTSASLVLNGGIIENNGTMTVTGRQAVDAIRFDNGTSGSVNSTYMGSGTLTCATSSTTGGGGNSTTGASISFNQTSGTATFTLTSTGIYNFNTGAGPIGTTPFFLKTAILCLKGNAQINGTGTITIGANRRSVRVISFASGDTPNLTIESGVTMGLSSTMTNGTGGSAATNTGIVLLENNQASGSASITNKGTLNFSGDIGNPIYMTNGSSATTTTNFTNQGTININGSFADATATTTTGGIYFAGANGTVGNSFSNSGTINLNTTASGTSAKPLFYSVSSPKNLITNSGTITVGTNGAPPIAIRLGDAKTTFDNTGTITLGAGSISAGTANANFNNNTGGVVNSNAAATSSNVLFTNNAGSTFNVATNQRIGRLTFNGGSIAIANGVTFTTFALILPVTSGHIPLGTGNIVIENGGNITGGSLAAHIITNGTGTVTQTIAAAASVVFPIGQSAMSYDPVTIKPAALLNFSARVGLQTTAIAPSNNSLVVNREWDITGTTGTTDLTFVSSALNKDGSSTRPSGSVGVVGHYNVAGAAWDANISAGYTLDTWTVTGYTGSFSPFIVASPGIVLSTELLNIKVKAVNNTNVVSWETASETNNKGFDVERKTANGTWETLGFVKGIGKAATYTFEDKGPLSISYYRLRQVDFDGKETLSKVVSVSQTKKGQMRISPNPTSDIVNIQLNQDEALNQAATLVLSDMTGRQVLVQTTAAGTFQLDLSNLAKGMYVVTVQANNAIYQEKIIHQ
jgi:Secretion system C-terminal sorting domain